jgi:hypothetical protein
MVCVLFEDMVVRNRVPWRRNVIVVSGIAVAEGRSGCRRGCGCGSTEVLQHFGGRLVFGVEAALAIVYASLTWVLAGTLRESVASVLFMLAGKSDAREEAKTAGNGRCTHLEFRSPTRYACKNMSVT